ncbi:hypothetical protein MK632_13715 [Rhizobium changzhiense]|uniref:hypothetical protein n=1 Tax=Rhizobium changzhiense TaxID=2692317 RepID=UPI001F0B749B|nr:hypothetical protein [Rhizobium changzhiense]MCH4546832.1 hypothetical protein [Rhizobium changzhiense]
MALRIVQITCIVLAAGILYAIGRFLLLAAHWGGPGFVDGALFGGGFVIVFYLLICWIDPSSRPRGTGSKQ